MGAVTAKLSVQCVDDPNGIHGVVVYGEQTTVGSRRDTNDGNTNGADGQGPHSSVRPFQSPCANEEEIPMEIDQQDVINHSQANYVTPFACPTEVDIPMEVDQ